MFSRRSFVSAVAALLLALSPIACTSVQIHAAMKQAAMDTSLIALSLKNALPQLAAIQGMPADTITELAGYVDDLQRVAAAINAAASASEALPSVQQLEADLNSIVGALATFPLPPNISTVLQAATVLLPVIEVAVGIAVPPQAGPMSPAQARAVLSVS
jgi:hypothetical protein